MSHACWGWKCEAEVKAGKGGGFCNEALGVIHGKRGQSPCGPWSHTDAFLGRGMEAPVMGGP